MIIKGEFVERYSALPLGDFYLRYKGARYIATRKESEDGKRGWLYAHEMGGNDHISFNFYKLSHSNRLKPCEMPAEKVINFVLELRVEDGTKVDTKTKHPSNKIDTEDTRSFDERFPPEPFLKRAFLWVIDRLSAIF